jgi:hypothetical protein
MDKYSGQRPINRDDRDGVADKSLAGLTAKLLSLFPTVGPSALANELTVERSPYALGAAAATPGFVVGVLTVRMVAGINGKHEHPGFSDILLESPNWGKPGSATVQLGLSLSVLICELLIISSVAYGGGGASRNCQLVELVAGAGINLAIFQWQAVAARD